MNIYPLTDDRVLDVEPDTIYWQLYLSDKTRDTLVNIDLIFAARIDIGSTFKVYWMTEREAYFHTRSAFGMATRNSDLKAEQVAHHGIKVTDLVTAEMLFPQLVKAGLKAAV